MPFNPEIGQELQIDNVTYHLTEHPAAPGIPYGQEGRAAVVYQLLSTDGKTQALKVFKPHYRLPTLVGQAEKIASYATLPGLQVCARTVLSARRHGTLLRQYPDLTYAILMPWIAGPTWTSLLLEKHALLPEQGLALARALAYVLAGMEEHGLAHCDLSGSNLLLPGLISSSTVATRSAVELVDMEQLYSSDLKRPETLPGGSPGYIHISTPDSLWSAYADRFAGAVLLAEILGWCEAEVRETAWGENYFAPNEIQRESERAQTLTTALTMHWGKAVVHLFEQAWRSDTLAACPTFGEWLVTLPETVPVMQDMAQTVLLQPPSPTTAPVIEDTLRAFMRLAQQFETQGNLIGALQTYHQALTLATPGSGLAAELAVIVKDLEAQQVVMPTETTVPGITTQAETVMIEAKSPSEPQLPLVSKTMPEVVAIESISEANPVGPLSEVVVESEEEIQTQELPELPTRSLPATQPDLAKLFDDGLAAYRKQDWIAARELFTAVVQQEPEYTRDGKAVDILADVENRLTAKKSPTALQKTTSSALQPSMQHPEKTPTKRRWFAWVALGVITLAIVALIVINGIDSPQGVVPATPTQSGGTPSVASIPTSISTSDATATPQSTLVAPSPTPLLDLTSLAEILTGGEMIQPQQLVYADNFNYFSSAKWRRNAEDSDIQVTSGTLRLVGKSFWANNVAYNSPVKEGQAVVVAFKYEPGTESEIYLEAGEWEQSDYRRWGIYPGADLIMNLFDGLSNEGGPTTLMGNLTMVPDMWYYTLLNISCIGEFTAAVWEKDMPQNRAEYHYQFSDRWQKKSWDFKVAANQGTVVIDTFAILSISDCENNDTSTSQSGLTETCIQQEYSEIKPKRYVYTSDREDPKPTPGYLSFEYEAVYVSENGNPSEEDLRISVLGGNRNPVWSPDGKSIAYIHIAEDWSSSQVILADWPQSTSRTIKGNYAAISVGLSWSPDGKGIVFENADTTIGKYGIFILDVQTGGIRQIIQNRSGGYPWSEDLSWSPCGEKIAFWLREGPDEDGWVIYTINTDGTDMTRITDVDDGRGLYGPLLWSVDGQFLIFTSFTVDSEGNRGPAETWVASIDSGEFYPLTDPIWIVDQSYYPWFRYLTP